MLKIGKINLLLLVLGLTLIASKLLSANQTVDTKTVINKMITETKIPKKWTNKIKSDEVIESTQIEDYFSKVNEVESLKPVVLADVKKKNSIWILFQKGCQSCHLMMSESKCVSKNLASIYFLGILSRPESLLMDARNSGYKGKIYYSETELSKILNLEVTPTIYFFNKDKLIKRVDSYLSCKKIKKILKRT